MVGKAFRAKFPQLAPPAPVALSADKIAALGDALDAAERDFNEAFAMGLTYAHGLDGPSVRLFRLRAKYFGAVRMPWFVAIDELEDVTRTTGSEVDSGFDA
jgi:hypothetical protein